MFTRQNDDSHPDVKCTWPPSGVVIPHGAGARTGGGGDAPGPRGGGGEPSPLPWCAQSPRRGGPGGGSGVAALESPDDPREWNVCLNGAPDPGLPDRAMGVPASGSHRDAARIGACCPAWRGDKCLPPEMGLLSEFNCYSTFKLDV